MTQALATIRRIAEIKPHPNADFSFKVINNKFLLEGGE